MLERDALDRVLEILKPEHFYSDANRRIFTACVELASSYSPVDITTVAAWLRSREWINQIGGPPYLVQLVDATPSVAHVVAHAQVVHEKWRVRQLIGACQRIAAEGYGDVGNVVEFIDGAEQSVYFIAHDKRAEETGQTITQILKTVFENIQKIAESGQKMSGYPSGFDAYDAKAAGIHDCEFRIIAGRPSMGKTALAMNEAVNVASPKSEMITMPDGETTELVSFGRGVIICSLEMPKEQLVIRMLCGEARVELNKIRMGMLQPEDWRRLSEAAQFLSTLPIWINDKPGMTLLEIRAMVRRIQAEWNRVGSEGQQARRIGVVYIDYLQLMKGRGGNMNREQEVSEISRGLKGLAKECKVNVTALSQLNRAVETRSKGGKGGRPVMSDLRESGSLEQDADVIMFIYRDEYYNAETTKLKGIAEVNIAKQRQGETGRIYLRFTGQYTRFDNLAPGEQVFDDEGSDA
jgi:replicative DNA helicase